MRTEFSSRIAVSLRELRRPPYRAILKSKPLSFRVKNAVKCAFPALHKLYRKARGYNE